MKRLFVAMVLLHFCFLANALSIEFTLDIPEVKVGEHFQIQYTLTCDQKVSGEEFVAPDFGDIEVIVGPTKSMANSIQFINGQAKHTCSVSYIYVLKCNWDGEYQIGEAQIKVGGNTYRIAPRKFATQSYGGSKANTNKTDTHNNTPIHTERTKFRGIEIDGSLVNFGGRLESIGYVRDKNYTPTNSSAAAHYTGIYGDQKCDLYVYTTLTSKKVYGVQVIFGQGANWQTLQQLYNKYKSLLTEKLGSPYQNNDNNDDLMRMRILGSLDTEAEYNAIWRSRNATMSFCWIEITSYEKQGYIQITFVDPTNYILNNNELKDSI